MAIPYAPRDYYHPNSDRLIDILMQRGQIAARGAENSGRIWSGAVNSLGGIASDFMAQRAQERQAQAQQDMARKQDEAFQGLLGGDSLPDPKAVLSIYGPERGMKIVSGLASFAQMSQSQGPEAVKHLPAMISGFAALSPEMQKHVYPALKQTAVRSGLFPADSLPDELTPELASEIINFGKGFAPGKEEAGFNLSPGMVRFGPDNKQVAAVPMASSLEGDRFAETVRHNRVMENKPTGGSESLTRVEHQDDNGQTIVEYLPKSEIKGKVFKKGLGATESNRSASAETVSRLSESMVQKVMSPEMKYKLGPILGRFRDLQSFIGNPPPEFAQLAGEIESFALANMGVHGMRSVQGANDIKKFLSARYTPESLAAAIRGLSVFSNEYMKTVGRGGRVSEPPSTDPAPAVKDPLGIR